jgi:hypothetical protein
MSGMVAIVAHGQSPVPSDEVDRLADTYTALRLEPPQVRLANSRIGMVRFSTDGEGDSGYQTDDASWAAYVGLPRGGPSLTSRPVSELDGAFALIRYDARRDEVLVASDPFGMQALYTAQYDAKTYVSTSALVLAKHLQSAGSALHVFAFLRLGLLFGPLTHWAGVERLEPAAEIRIDPDGLHRDTYWRSPIEASIARLPFAETVDRCADVLLETLGRDFRDSPPLWADLTGGFDTRLLALGLDRVGIEFDTNTAGAERDRDVQIARRLAAEVGWPWVRFHLPDDWSTKLPGRLAHAVAWGDGLLDASQLAEVLWTHELKSRRHPYLLIGGGGEHFRNFAWQQEFLRAGRAKDVNWENWWEMRLVRPADLSIFAHNATPEARELVQSHMTRWIEPYSDELNTVKLDMLYAYKSTGHFGGYRSAAMAFLNAQLPFYSKPIFTSVTSTAFRYRNNHRLARHLIARLNPVAAAMATATGTPAEPWRLTSVHRFAPYYARLARKVVEKVSERSLGRPLFPVGTQRMEHRSEVALALLRHLEGEGGASYGDMRLQPLLDKRSYQDLVWRMRARRREDPVLFGRIVTAELALRASDTTLER